MPKWSQRKFKEALERRGLTFDEVAEKLVREKNWPSNPHFLRLQLQGLAKDREPVLEREHLDIADVVGVGVAELMEETGAES